MIHAIVIPAIDPDNTRGCLESMSKATRDRVILIDNTDDMAIAAEWRDRVHLTCADGRNRGVAASWNTGARCAFAEGASFVTVCSASMRFFRDGGEALCRVADFAAGHDQWLHGFESLNGWHLFTLGRATWDLVGEFDEAFFPAYFEDNDYIYRMRVAGILEPAGGDRSARLIPWVPTLTYECVGDAQAVKRCGIEVDLTELAAYYERKWGGPPGAEVFRTPFDVEHIRQEDTGHGSVTRSWVGYRGDMEYPIVDAFWRHVYTPEEIERMTGGSK